VSRHLHLRLSNTVDAAVEFTSAPDPGALAAVVREAFEEYCHRQRAVWGLGERRVARRAEPGLSDGVSLHLHVRVGPDRWTDPLAVTPTVTHGWPADALEPTPDEHNSPWQAVVFHWPLPPADDPRWAGTLAWCQNAAEYGRALRGLTSRVAHEVQPPAELSDPDRRGGVV
jgi:hypothetical protein